MNKIIFFISILLVWLLSGSYSFDLMKGKAVVNSIQVWEFYKNPTEDFKFVVIHIFLSLIIGAILGLALSFLFKPKSRNDMENDS